MQAVPKDVTRTGSKNLLAWALKGFSGRSRPASADHAGQAAPTAEQEDGQLDQTTRKAAPKLQVQQDLSPKECILDWHLERQAAKPHPFLGYKATLGRHTIQWERRPRETGQRQKAWPMQDMKDL